MSNPHDLAAAGDVAGLENFFKRNPTVSIDVQNRQRKTPLHKAARAANLAVVSWLISHGADVNAQDDCGSEVTCWMFSKPLQEYASARCCCIR